MNRGQIAVGFIAFNLVWFMLLIMTIMAASKTNVNSAGKGFAFLGILWIVGLLLFVIGMISPSMFAENSKKK